MPKRYKGKNEQIEIISARSVFDLCEYFGEGNHEGFSLYNATDKDDEKKRWKCDMGDLGGFWATNYNGEEEWDNIRHDWIWVEGNIFNYSSYSSSYNGYPNTIIETAYDFLLAAKNKLTEVRNSLYEPFLEEVKKGNYIPHSLWAILTDERQRDGYALGYLKFEGSGEYQCIEVNGKSFYVKSESFDKARQHCPVHLIPLNRMNIYHDKGFCSECSKFYYSYLDKPFVLEDTRNHSL